MPRNPAAGSSPHLSIDNLHRRVDIYSLAAAAAGVSVLALAIPAKGEVVITRKKIAIPEGPPIGISLANNGIDDFTFTLSTFYSASTHLARTLRVNNASGGRGVVGSFRIGDNRRYASALIRGAKIGPSANFASLYPGNRVEASYSISGGRLVGKWGGGAKNRYVGVRFLLQGGIHYGWIRLSVDTGTGRSLNMSATITAYAYETVANTPVLAGTAVSVAEKPKPEVQTPQDTSNQPGPSLGMLAAGADALPIWRRE
jgi:hypothetical protein